MAAVTESIKVVLMRLNCRRYCRPLPPPNPSNPPLSVQRLRRRFNPPVFHPVPLPFTVSQSLASSCSPQHAPGSLYLFLWISFFPSNLRVQIAPTSAPLSACAPFPLPSDVFILPAELCLKTVQQYHARAVCVPVVVPFITVGM